MPTASLCVLFAIAVAFSPYAPFYSSSTSATPAVDPQVFVKDSTATAGVGPQSIAHAAGYRPALLQSDPAGSPLFNAHGAPLGLTLGQWLGATGSADFETINANAQSATVRFAGLSPYGAYSVFVHPPGQDETAFLPLDGAGVGNTFVADAGGSASLNVFVSPPLANGSAIVVVFHSDGLTHGLDFGAPGITSHIQLIAFPARR
jgi:hypothetical protein